MDLNVLQSFILGIIQGLTEFLPISSTAHLLLGSRLMDLKLSDFLKSFIVLIQLGSILAVIILYWKKVWSDWQLYFKKIIVAFIPTAILGVLFYKVVKNYLQESMPIISLALFLGGVLMIVFERWYKEKKEIKADLPVETEVEAKDIPYSKCAIIGVFQALAMVPGVSRSAATVLGGLALGISRVAIVEFSFLLAVPTMLAASAMDLYKTAFNFSGREVIILAVGFITSFIVAWFSVKFLLSFVKKNSFALFGWYRVFIGVILFLSLYVF